MLKHEYLVNQLKSQAKSNKSINQRQQLKLSAKHIKNSKSYSILVYKILRISMTQQIIGGNKIA